MKLFLDFDDTLFNTNEFYAALEDVFDGAGVPKELFWQSYQELRSEAPSEGWCYSFEVHIERLRRHIVFDEDGLRKTLASVVLNTEKYLFPDAKDFLESLRNAQHEVFILSFGDVSHQTAKISGSGIARYIERNIITDKEKGAALEGEIASHERAWFIDDRAHCIESVKRFFPQIRTILMRRRGGRFRDDPNEYCDYVANDLIEGEKILHEHVS